MRIDERVLGRMLTWSRVMAHRIAWRAAVASQRAPHNNNAGGLTESRVRVNCSMLMFSSTSSFFLGGMVAGEWARGRSWVGGCCGGGLLGGAVRRAGKVL